jgi:PAS domain S-box-containing protein
MLQLLIQNVSEIVVVIDADGIVRFANPQLQKVLGLPPENVLGKNIFDFVHPDDEYRARLEYSETVRKPGEGVPSTLRIRDVTGEWVPFEIIANNQIEDPDIRGVIFTARDLRFRRDITEAIQLANLDLEKRVEERTTELAKANSALRLENQARRDTERRLHETISLLHATLDSTADGILVVDRQGRVSGCNRRFVEMWQLSCEPKTGGSDTELMSRVLDQLRDPDEFIAKVNALYSNPDESSFDVLFFKDGRIYERYSQPQRLHDQIVGRVWSFRDVTEARHLEEELRHAQKVEALGRLAGGVAHDFNNLLMLLWGYLGQLSDSGFSLKQREACEQAIAVTKRATALTRQMLAFSRKHPESPTVTDLNTIISNMHAILRSLVSDYIRLEISLVDDPVPIFVDVAQIEVVLMNLAINAHDAMPSGGVLSVATGKKEEGSSTFAVLTVADSGKGMSPEVQARIFEPFFTTKEPGKGTGLGLATVFDIVRRFGGYVEVESKPNHGTQFRIFFPATRIAQPIERAKQVPLPARGNETILLAEDESGIRSMTKAYLESLGYHVLEAADGDEAVRISREYTGRIDLVLTDLLMPIMRGDAVVRFIRERRPDVKALYISGYSENLSKDQGSELLAKPFEFPELGRRVRSVLDIGYSLPRAS